VAKGKPVVTWNIELDTLRGDLGLVSFPPKDLQYRSAHMTCSCSCSHSLQPQLQLQPQPHCVQLAARTLCSCVVRRAPVGAGFSLLVGILWVNQRQSRCAGSARCRWWQWSDADLCLVFMCRFLSKLRPVFYLRPRDYSKSVAVAPFIINYSGALFREYPGPWQVGVRPLCVVWPAGGRQWL
jgi:hypothetical protein